MSNSKTAIVSMEEEYMRLEINYTQSDERTQICATIDDIEKELDLYPEVIHKRNDNGGNYYIEFDKDTYMTTRLPGEFIDKVLHALGIEHCEKR